MRRRIPFPFRTRRRGIGVVGIGVLLLIGLVAGDDQTTKGGGSEKPPPVESTQTTTSTERPQEGGTAEGPATRKPRERRRERRHRRRKPGVRAQVVDVTDGDTISVRFPGGREESIRYIGVDTPETVHPTEPVGCYGPKASHFNEALVAGRQVRLRFDRERRDYYGRLLAYVYRGGLFVNAELVRRGLARAVYYSPNGAFRYRFESLQQRAARKGRGLWGACRR